MLVEGVDPVCSAINVCLPAYHRWARIVVDMHNYLVYRIQASYYLIKGYAPTNEDTVASIAHSGAAICLG